MVVRFNSQSTQNTEAKQTDAQFLVIDKINNYLLTLSKVPLKERLFFVKHLALMLKAGISLSRALNTLASQSENKLFEKTLHEIATKVEKGSSFAESLAPYNKIFGEMFISMIDAGEISGKLEDVLEQLFVQMKKALTP